MVKFKNLLEKEMKLLWTILILLIFMNIFAVISGFIINMSPSITPGLYILYPKFNIVRGDIINFSIPESIKEQALERNYIRVEIKTLTKYVGATSGDMIERKDNKLYINGVFKGNIYLVDSKNRELVSVLIEDEKVILKKGEYFTLGTTDNSLDSRYFGLITEDKIIKKAKLILAFIKKYSNHRRKNE